MAELTALQCEEPPIEIGYRMNIDIQSGVSKNDSQVRRKKEMIRPIANIIAGDSNVRTP